MHALQQSVQTKKTAERERGRGDAAPDANDAPQYNPLWQWLALRPSAVQPKLTASRPDAPQEGQATVAGAMLRMPDASPEACACGPGCSGCGGVRQPAVEEGRLPARRAEISNDGQAATAPPIVREVLTSPGRLLDHSALALMEHRFGRSFREVRVHTDARASESARAINALAYTAGSSIVFDTGQYSPHTEGGRKLLAHELTHVAQQSAASDGAATHLPLGRPGDVYEQEAERMAESAESGTRATAPPRLTPLRAPVIHRMARFENAPVYAGYNAAEQIMRGRAGADNPADNPRVAEMGICYPVLNGRRFLSAVEARAAINRPTITSEAAGGQGALPLTRCRVGLVPDNIATFDLFTLSGGPWWSSVPKAALAERLRQMNHYQPQCDAAPAGDAIVVARGVPSDAAVAAFVRRHETQHALGHMRAFNSVVVPWDAALTRSRSAQQTLTEAGPLGAESCAARLYQQLGGTPDEIADRLAQEMIDNAVRFHASGEGRPVELWRVEADAQCNRVTFELHEYSGPFHFPWPFASHAKPAATDTGRGRERPKVRRRTGRESPR